MKQSIKLNIAGMHCGSCEQLIKSELEDLGHIDQVTINHQTGEGEVSFDSGKISKEQIFEAIKKAGYDAIEIETSSDKADKPVIGKVVYQATGPVKVQLESKTDATGTVFTDENGLPKFEGTIENKKKANFVLPKGVENPSEWLNSILSEVNFSQVFDQTKANGTIQSRDYDIAQSRDLNSGVSIQSRDLNTPLVNPGISSDAVPVKSRDLTELDKKQRVQLSLSGMHCASCAGLIEKSLKRVPGVTEANVNFAAEKASVLVNKSQVSNETLIVAVNKAGYGATLVDTANPEVEAAKKKKTLTALTTKFWASFILSTPMLYFMLFDFFPKFPGASQLLPYVGIISFILTIPVQLVIGAGFYKGMWSALRMKTFNMDSLIAIGTSTAFIYSVVNFFSYAIKNQSLIGLNGEKNSGTVF